MNNISTTLRTFFCTCLLGGIVFSAQAQTPPYSGYLKDYSGLQAHEDALGNTVMRYADPKLNPQNYKAVIVEKVVLYPAPQPSDEVNAPTLAAIAKHADNQLREVLGSQIKIVNQAGPGVARLKVAITGSALEKEGLKPYQYVPVAFLLTAAKRASSGAPHQVNLMIEAEVTDSVSGERLLTSVRQGKGDTFDGDKVTVDSLKPLLGKWMAGVANEVPKFVAAK